jgi:hypothetical protein
MRLLAAHITPSDEQDRDQFERLAAPVHAATISPDAIAHKKGSRQLLQNVGATRLADHNRLRAGSSWLRV